MRGPPSPDLAGRLKARLARRLNQSWWADTPDALARALQPLSWLYANIAERKRRSTPAAHAPVPVLVVGNLVAGGAGKTPTVIALAAAFKAAGHRPGVVSRGYGRITHAVQAVAADDDPRQVGDEPLLIARRTGVPVWVGRDRVAAARALCAAEPTVDLLISDDGLQHHALARDAELIVFDDRGAGNGLLLPAGPLREPLPATLAPHQRVLHSTTLASHRRVLHSGNYNSTPLGGFLAEGHADRALLLADWRAGAGASGKAPSVALASLRGQRLLAVAGMANPRKFYDNLTLAGLQFDCLPLPDHHPYAVLPWPADTAAVITTEKDAVKLDPERLPGLLAASPRVWVVPLDLKLPEALAAELLALLFMAPTAAAKHAAPNRPAPT